MAKMQLSSWYNLELFGTVLQHSISRLSISNQCRTGLPQAGHIGVTPAAILLRDWKHTPG